MDIFLITMFIVTCLLLIVVVLLQKGRGGGLSGAFGGGSSSSAFGTKTGDVFTWVTIVLTAIFLILACVASLVYHPPIEDVPEPVLQPAAGPISEATAVLIVRPIRGYKYYYTLDGSEPTAEKSRQFEGKAVMVQPETTLKVRSWYNNRFSKTVTAVYPRGTPTTMTGTTGVDLPITAPDLSPTVTGTSAPAVTGTTTSAVTGTTTSGMSGTSAPVMTGTMVPAMSGT